MARDLTRRPSLAATCGQPDHDEPRMVCGYPLPCPWHTAVIDATREPATVTLPVTANIGAKGHARLRQVARAVGRLPEVRRKDGKR